MMMRATSRRFISSARLAVWERDRFANQSLFEDRYAALLAEKDDLPSTAHGIVSSLADTMAIRTRAIDAWLEKPSWPPVRTTRRQVVILGSAGLDTRSYRLGLGQATTIYEVEPTSDILANKREVLADAGVRQRTMVVDVCGDPAEPRACEAALLAAGFDPRVPTRWVVEGPLTGGDGVAPPDYMSTFQLASRIGGTPASALAAQVLQPDWAKQFTKEPCPGIIAPGGLVPLATVLDAARSAGWREKRTMRQADFKETFGRGAHESFALIFADADTDP